MKIAIRLPFVLSSLLLPLTPAWAAPVGNQSPEDHGNQSDDIVVTAPYLADMDLLSANSTVTAEALLKDLKPQIADQLVTQPGVSASSFAPGASRPVLRGMQGDRVRILTDGIGTLDASSTSADHGVAIDPLTADRVEIFRGPASLLFGSQAIGGAVNVFDRRIPRKVPVNLYHLDAVGAMFGALDEKSAGAALDLKATDHWVVHADGSYRKTGNVAVGGYILSPTLRKEQQDLAAQELAEGDGEAAALAQSSADLSGHLPDSASQNWTLGLGTAFIAEGGSLGVSIGWYDSQYGVPARPGANHADAPEAVALPVAEGLASAALPVSINLHQVRADVRGELNIGGTFADKLRLRVGYADYRHGELEGNQVGTQFFSKGMEGRLELVQADRGGWRGVVGVQGSVRDFDAVGDEAFVPPNETSQMGLFALQQWKSGALGLEAALRYEQARLLAKPYAGTFLDLSGSAPLTFNSLSGALGVSVQATEGIKLGVNLSRAARAPSAEELFSFGPHIATQAFEQGRVDLAIEHSWGLEAYVQGEFGPVVFSASAYHSWFSDFIYDSRNGVEMEGLPVYAYQQAPARHWGMEGQLDWPLIDRPGLKVNGHIVTDYIHATISGFGPAPRIPPFRILAGLDVEKGILGADISLEHVSAQNRVAVFETPTDGFMVANGSVNIRPWGRDSETQMILSANNLFNVDARRHASFTKDFAPLAGRDIRVSARVSF